MRERELMKLLKCKRRYELDMLNLKSSDDKLKFFIALHEIIKHSIKVRNEINVFKLVEATFSESFKREWFELEDQYLQEKYFELSLYKRLVQYFTSEEFRLVKIDSSYRVDKSLLDQDEITGTVDLIVKRGTEYEAIKIKRGTPKFSYRARKINNKPEYSLELILMKLGLESKYPGIKVSLFYLKNKDDTRDNIVDTYNHKLGKNIISSKFDGLSKRELLQRIDTILQFDENRDCEYCEYNNICNRKKCTRNENENTISSSKKKANNENKVEFKLSKKQKEVINHKNGVMRIIACAGAGKTTVLVERLVNLVNQGIDPQNILFLTFTNKACEEIKERVRDRLMSLNMTSTLPHIKTLNSLGAEILKENKTLLGIDQIKLTTKIHRYNLIKECLGLITIPNMNYSHLYNSSYGLLAKVDSLISKLDGVTDYKEFAEKNKLSEMTVKALVELKQLYDILFKQEGFIDYSDQISLANKLLEENISVKEFYNCKYKYIMVDECQDIDESQNRLILNLSLHGNIVICGDDDQSIYRFRKGSNEYMLNFHKNFSCKDVILEDNFRSAPKILELANTFIKNNLVRFGKTVRANKPSVAKPIFVRDSSNAGIVDIITDLFNKGFNLCDIAVIARNNSSLYKLSSILDTHNIKYISPKNYLRDDPKFLGVLEFLEAINDIHNNINLYNILTNHYGLKDTVIIGKDKETSLYNHLIKQNNNSISTFLDDIVKISSYATLKDKLQYVSYSLFREVDGAAIKVLLNIIDEEGLDSLMNLLKHMKDLVLYSDDTRVEMDDIPVNNLNLLTAHDSKGKEFKAVIIQDIDKFNYKDLCEEEEERRILYVALTRAKDLLYITKYPSKKSNSPFFDELCLE